MSKKYVVEVSLDCKVWIKTEILTEYIPLIKDSVLEISYDPLRPVQIPKYVNIADNKKGTVSSGFENSANLTDGKADTTWRSSNEDVNPFFSVDLYADSEIYSIYLYWQDKYFPRKFLLKTSPDGINWAKLTEVTNEDEDFSYIFLQQGVKTRYLMVYTLQKNDSFIEVKEFEVNKKIA